MADSGVDDKIKKRIRDLSEWMNRESPECFYEQRHLDSGTSEQVYWNFGYLCALRDVLRLILGLSKEMPN